MASNSEDAQVSVQGYQLPEWETPNPPKPNVVERFSNVNQNTPLKKDKRGTFIQSINLKFNQIMPFHHTYCGFSRRTILIILCVLILLIILIIAIGLGVGLSRRSGLLSLNP